MTDDEGLAMTGRRKHQRVYDKPAQRSLSSITAHGKQNKIEELSNCLKRSRHVG